MKIKTTVNNLFTDSLNTNKWLTDESLLYIMENLLMNEQYSKDFMTLNEFKELLSNNLDTVIDIDVINMKFDSDDLIIYRFYLNGFEFELDTSL